MRNPICGMFLAVVSLFVAVPVISPAGEPKLEPGFTALFNGKDLTGWKTKAGESLDGKTEAHKGRFKVVDGKLVIDPKVPGDVWIKTDRKFEKDVHVKLDFFPGKGCNNDTHF